MYAGRIGEVSESKLLTPSRQIMFALQNKLFVCFKRLSDRYPRRMSPELSTYVEFLNTFNTLFSIAVRLGTISPTCLPSNALVRVREKYTKKPIITKDDLEVYECTTPHNFTMTKTATGSKLSMVGGEKKRKDVHASAPPDIEKDINICLNFYNGLLHGNSKRLTFVNRDNAKYWMNMGNMVDRNTLIVDPRLVLQFEVPCHGDKIKQLVRNARLSTEYNMHAHSRQMCMHPTMVMKDDKVGVQVNLPLTDMYIDDVVRTCYATTNSGLLNHIFRLFSNSAFMKTVRSQTS